MSAKFAMLKNRWELGWITEETLRGWVEINERKPGKGITAEEFESITGKKYRENADGCRTAD